MALKLTTKITGGLLLLNALLLGLVAVAFFGLNAADRGFSNYRDLARDTNLVANVQAQMLTMRIQVLGYLDIPTAERLAEYRERYEAMIQLLNEANREITDPERQDGLRRISQLVTQYADAFNTITTITTQMAAHRDEVLMPAQQAFRTQLDALFAASRDSQNPAWLAAVAQIRAQGLITLLALADDTTDPWAGFTAAAAAWPSEAPSLASVLAAQTALQTAVTAHNALQASRQTTTETLYRIGPEVADIVETTIKLDIKDEQDRLGPQLQAENQSRINLMVGVTAGALLLSLALGLWLVRSLRISLGVARQAVDQLAEGDLTRPIDTVVHDELGALVELLEQLRQRLGETTLAVRQSAETVHRGVTELRSGNETLGQRTEQQASNLEETAASMEQMTSSVRQNADNTQQASQLAQQARQRAQQGDTVVGNAVAGMDAIHGASRKIEAIISVIDEIAFQTNLLALNASVEAARAGEQGRGFAVVAGEVRNLAQRSATAAQEIKELIQDSTHKVAAGTKLVAGAGQTLKEIVHDVQRVSALVADIATASAEQSTGIEQVNQAVMQMEEFTQQNAALVEQTNAANQSISEQAQQLVQLLAFFRTETA